MEQARQGWRVKVLVSLVQIATLYRRFCGIHYVMSQVDDRITLLSTALEQVAVAHECYHDCVFVTIPGGQLEVKIWEDGSESVQMIPGDFHTHLEILAMEHETSGENAFASFVRSILDGRRPVIQETSPEGVVRTTIEESLESYLQYLPSGATFRVLNAT